MPSALPFPFSFDTVLSSLLVHTLGQWGADCGITIQRCWLFGRVRLNWAWCPQTEQSLKTTRAFMALNYAGTWTLMNSKEQILPRSSPGYTGNWA